MHYLVTMSFILSLFMNTTAQAVADFSGNWSTTWGKGSLISNMILQQSDSSVNGSYTYQGGNISGKVQGHVLMGTWYQQDNGARGTFSFTLSPDGQSFKGRWRNGASGPWLKDVWNGVKY
ncbi:hypothetical protein [Candidatus Venteria ishoeyi]|uniref:Uncharacterized protein n=1 Tax=Candidatus Venteria ishoeyi TaxID=1899563 RepID=A0A1H6FD18_9GAMM|nr:hypothetical protein [Candidatus Venteria ishoeyi]MDM8546394.1 hypothetical protein [Candidatus Venteria ishoeyi]SEH07533.1 Uncharacterised protein [Candidatus Venteria ishoeyi]